MRWLDTCSGIENPFDLMLQLGAVLASHLLHSQHHGGQGEATEEVHDLPPLVALHRQPVDPFQQIATHTGHLEAASCKAVSTKG